MNIGHYLMVGGISSLLLSINTLNAACTEAPGKPTIQVTGAQGTSSQNVYVIGIPTDGEKTVKVTGNGSTPCPTSSEKCVCLAESKNPESDGSPKYTFDKTVGSQSNDGPDVEWKVNSSTAPGEYKFKVTKIEQKYKACPAGWTGGVASKENTQASDEVTVIAARVKQILVDSSDTDSTYIKDDNKTDIIGTVKGTGDVVLKAEVEPDRSEVKDLVTWTGVTQDTDKVKAKKDRSADLKLDFTALVAGTETRKGRLWIVWGEFTKFQTSGPKPSDSDVEPPTWGVQAGVGQNGCLMQITLKPAGVHAVTEITYDIKRTKERGSWSKFSTTWTNVTYAAPGSDDDARNTDEDLTPSTDDHIYSEDVPGFASMTSTDAERKYVASFIEFLNIKIGSAAEKKGSSDYPWHSYTHTEKTPGTIETQRRKSGGSAIATGSTTVGNGSNPP